jgi:hypothetical protein
MYHGSDQAFFAVIFGEQEYQQEVMRRRHHSIKDEIAGCGAPPKPNYIFNTRIDDPLKPSFPHELRAPKEGKPDEFSLDLDYFSDFIQ